jgi:hypothetical protein
MSASITLFVPGLFQQLSEREAPDCPPSATLERLLARSDRSRFASNGKDDCLTQLFGIDGGAPPPVAALGWLADSDASTAPSTDWTGNTHCWLRADPVHLHPDRDRLLLFDASQLQVTAVEAEALSVSLSEFLSEDGIRLHAPQPDRWYLQLPDSPALHTSALDQVSGRDILPYMPAGEDGPGWRQRLNEVQMLLFQHPVNERREQRGQPTINSLWFWGNGALPAAPSPRFTQVFSDDPLACGLARLSTTPCASLTDLDIDINTGALVSAWPEGNVLLQFDAVHSALTLGDADAWQAALQRLQQAWLEPLTCALTNSRVASLTLVGGNGLQYRSKRHCLGRWWRRSHPYSSYLKTVRDSLQ